MDIIEALKQEESKLHRTVECSSGRYCASRMARHESCVAGPQDQFKWQTP